MTVAIQTGLRLSEMTALCCPDVHLGRGIDAKVALTEQALAKAASGPELPIIRYRPDDHLLAFPKRL